ncbi:hypothetical protein CARUB_v10021607mg [Capsella rubella]|uniref:pectinesterase n=1 Tax=Capsella rubella TaxID=81985 RepID=R0IBV1_9BRAS|nr:hypothetical protein CARUB_v10021607mg [Capsella rubella]
MESLVCVFALSIFYVTLVSSHTVSNVSEGIRLEDTNNDIVPTIVVDKYGYGNFKTIQSAIDSVPFGRNYWTKIYVRQGLYHEKVTIPRYKTKIQLEGYRSSQTIVQYNDAGSSVNSATLTVLAEFFVATNITFKEKPLTPYGEIRVAPAVLLAADKAAFYGCVFVSMQDTLGDLVGRHFFRLCYIKGAIDFIWGGGQSLYQSCTIEVKGVTTASNDEADGGLIAGYITAQGRASEQDTSGFVFRGCKILGSGKAFLGRAYGSHSRVLFVHTNMADVIVPQGWDIWTDPKQVSTTTFGEVNCYGPGANKKRRVAWEKKLSYQDVAYFVNRTTFINKEGWIESLPPHILTLSPSSSPDDNSFV